MWKLFIFVFYQTYKSEVLNTFIFADRCIYLFVIILFSCKWEIKVFSERSCRHVYWLTSWSIINFLILEPNSWFRSALQTDSDFSRYAFLSDYLTDLYTGKSKTKIHKKIVPSGVGTQDLQIISLMLYQLNQVNIQLPAWIFMAFMKPCTIDSRNEQSPTCEVVHETKLTSEISYPTNSCLPQLVEH